MIINSLKHFIKYLLLKILNLPFSNQKVNDKINYSKENNLQNINNEDLSYEKKDYPKFIFELEKDNNAKTELNIDNIVKKDTKGNKTIIKSKTKKKVRKKESLYIRKKNKISFYW